MTPVVPAAGFTVTWYPHWAWRPRRRPGVPGRWLPVTVATGWLLMVGGTVLASVESGGHAARGGHTHLAGDVSGGPGRWAWGVETVIWAGMIVATMLPLIAPNLRYVVLRSPRRHRGAATLDVVAGWAAVWVVTAVVLWSATSLAGRWSGRTATSLAAFGTAAVWQCTRSKRVRVARCERTLAPPLDRRAARWACRWFGVRLGADCAGSCWALMAAMAASRHSLVVVVPMGWVSWYERRRPHHDPPRASTVAVIAATGAAALGLGL